MVGHGATERPFSDCYEYTTQSDCQCLASEQKLRSLEQGVHRLKEAQNKTKVSNWFHVLEVATILIAVFLAVGKSGGTGDVCQEQSKERVCVT